MDKPLKSKDPATYTVHGLLAAGSRFTDDFEPEDAVQMYLELRPDALEADVRAELLTDLALCFRTTKAIR